MAGNNRTKCQRRPETPGILGAMNDLQDVWERYVSTWKVTDPAQKHELFTACLSPRCVYTDPLTVSRGWEELSAYMANFHQQVPGAYFVTEQFFSHHQRSAARWKMVTATGQTMAQGISYGEYDEQAKLVTMTGFFDPPAP